MGWIFVGGLVALIVGAELLVRGASRLALSFGISPLVVGLTIVALIVTKYSDNYGLVVYMLDVETSRSNKF